MKRNIRNKLKEEYEKRVKAYNLICAVGFFILVGWIAVVQALSN